MTSTKCTVSRKETFYVSQRQKKAYNQKNQKIR